MIFYYFSLFRVILEEECYAVIFHVWFEPTCQAYPTIHQSQAFYSSFSWLNKTPMWAYTEAEWSDGWNHGEWYDDFKYLLIQRTHVFSSCMSLVLDVLFWVFCELLPDPSDFMGRQAQRNLADTQWFRARAHMGPHRQKAHFAQVPLTHWELFLHSLHDIDGMALFQNPMAYVVILLWGLPQVPHHIFTPTTSFPQGQKH